MNDDTSPKATPNTRPDRRWRRDPYRSRIPRRRIDKLLGDRLTDALGLRRRRFEHAASSGVWSDTGESVSGTGSSLDATAKLRAVLPEVLVRLEVRSILDVPCGDWNWMSKVDLPIDHYIGGDIVANIVERNTAQYGRPDVEFRVIDLCTDDLPPADMLFCRDALIHFGERDIWRSIDNVRRAGITWFAATMFIDTSANVDIATGIMWRHVNLLSAPFSFPEPVELLIDDFNRPDQRMAIWRVADLPQSPGR